MTKLKTTFFSATYQHALKPLLFRRDPEEVHDRFIKLGKWLGEYATTRKSMRWLFNFEHKALEQNLWGLTFKNPVGLSGGFDKDAQLTQIIPSIGFGYMEIGTVTNQSYAGNPPPRLYRLPQSKGLAVYYGLKNVGVKEIICRLKNQKTQIPMSVSVGRTNSPDTATVESGIQDYFSCWRELIANNIGDLYTINISCPNTFDGEPFTTPKLLIRLLEKLYSLPITKPVLIKMPINLPWEEFKPLLDTALIFKVNGVIIGNLNKNHNDPAIKDIIPPRIKGGVSGQPTWKLSNELISQTYRYCGDKLMIIGTGGIFSAADAYEKITRGAALVQLITGMIYQGPQLIGEINRGLVKLLKRDGYKNISEAVGKYHKNN